MVDRKTTFPQLDADPSFTRVVRYFRPSDYAFWGASIAGFPAALWALEYVNPTQPHSAAANRLGYRVGAFTGLIGGFLLAYQRSSARFWGWTENEREHQRYLAEIEHHLRQGTPVHGTSRLTPYLQRIAANNSTFAASKFDVMPWFNVVSHPHHGEFNEAMIQRVRQTLQESAAKASS